ncbi:MAG: helix-turn-helix transcriptional regulator [Leptolyngbyaceae cyanobacterium]
MTSPQWISKQDPDWLAPGSPTDPRLFHAESGDLIRLYPAGQGYRQEIRLQDDLSLSILAYTLQQGAVVEGSGHSDCLKFEFQFPKPHTKRSSFAHYCGDQDFSITPGQRPVLEVEVILKRSLLMQYIKAFMERLPERFWPTLKQIFEYLSGVRCRNHYLTVVDLLNNAVTPPSARSVESLIQRLPHDLYGEFLDLGHTTAQSSTPAMQQVMAQILGCPYQGATRRTYLSRKALELVALYLEAMCQPLLPQDELESIYEAAAILRQQMVDPPAVEQLARRVCTNRLKLYQGFHAVYDTTPLGYLRNHRMGQAYRLFKTSDWSVSQVAAAVGYTSRNRFATAFRQSIGLNPKALQLQLQRYAS